MSPINGFGTPSQYFVTKTISPITISSKSQVVCITLQGSFVDCCCFEIFLDITLDFCSSCLLQLIWQHFCPELVHFAQAIGCLSVKLCSNSSLCFLKDVYILLQLVILSPFLFIFILSSFISLPFDCTQLYLHSFKHNLYSLLIFPFKVPDLSQYLIV